MKDHLINVANKCSEFAEKIDSKELGYLIGLYHDLGKYQEDFQLRLDDNRIRVCHSETGAVMVYQRDKVIGKMMAYIISGHHSGLPDYGTAANPASLRSKIEKSNIIDRNKYLFEINNMIPDKSSSLFPYKRFQGSTEFGLFFYLRFLYSCLVDADALDAEKASGSENCLYREIPYVDIPTLENILHEHMNKITSIAEETVVNKCRRNVLKECREKAGLRKGLYSLTVPTGGGKTLASMSFALKHAKKHKMSRIIYVIPYTSIIEQNAAVFADIFGRENILEHHSNFQYPEDESLWTDEDKRAYLATENWDAPVIVTTNVQFYESLFAAKKSKNRKLHNIANSVIVIDEAQTIPVNHLKPCLAALSELVERYNCSIVLCTATQPAIKRYVQDKFKPVELISNTGELFNALKRVEYKYIGKLNDDELVSKLNAHKQVLCIVGTKRHARELYSMFQGEGVYHLSASMCPAHRSKMLKKIHQALANNERCIVISTQVIEAGVDIDFPVIFHSMAGIDSLIQGGGRGNRNGKLDMGIVYIFESDNIPAGRLSREAAIARVIIKNNKDPFSLESINEYFRQLYNSEGDNLDKEDILGLIKEGFPYCEFAYDKISGKFKVIDSETISIIIPFDDRSRRLINELRAGNTSRKISRSLQPYVVQVYDSQYEKLAAAGLIENIDDTYFILKNMDHYDDKMGLLPA